MPATLYYIAASPPARAVLLTLKTLNIPYELHGVDFFKGEHMSEEFIKMNPQHTVPTFVDEDGFVVVDSHAINGYLVGKYGKDDQLYPKEVKARSVVDHRLHYDTGVLFQAIRFISKNFFFSKTITGITPQIISTFEDAYVTLERFLSSAGPYIAGNYVTIADFSVITSLANMSVFLPPKKEIYPLLVAYIDRCNKNIPHCAELNETGIQMCRGFFKDFNFQLPPP